ncbi:hypothetical protein BT69DRAFT_585995 [Atractiella rhizophila]|nr:hypothetical protein BT69DRAFT_585995 [Atractiella rhizophila]
MRETVNILRSFLHLSHGSNLVSLTIGAILRWSEATFTSLTNAAASEFSRWLATEIINTVSLPYKAQALQVLIEWLSPSERRDSKGKDAEASPKKDRTEEFRSLILTMITTILAGDTAVPAIGIVDVARKLVACLSSSSSPEFAGHIKSAISSLASHVYYADQISDIVEVLIANILYCYSQSSKDERIELLLDAIEAVVREADGRGGLEFTIPVRPNHDRDSTVRELPKITMTVAKGGERNRLKPALLQPLLVVLFAPKQTTRFAVQRFLIRYVATEMDFEIKTDDKENERFFSALFASVFVLVTGVGDAPRNLATRKPSLPYSNNNSKRSSLSVAGRASATVSSTAIHKASATPTANGNNVALTHSLPVFSITSIQPSEPPEPTLLDFSFAKEVLRIMQLRRHHTVVLSSVPAICAIATEADKVAEKEEEKVRKVALREIVAAVARSIGDSWGLFDITQALDGVYSVDPILPIFPTEFKSSATPSSSVLDDYISKTGSLDKASFIDALAGCEELIESSKLDRSALTKILLTEWTTIGAFQIATVGTHAPAIEVRTTTPSPIPGESSIMLQRRGIGTPSVSDLKATLGSVVLGNSTYNASTVNSTVNSNRSGRSQNDFGAGSSFISPKKLLKEIKVDIDENTGSTVSIFRPPYTDVKY